jgi:hypothetical protein
MTQTTTIAAALTVAFAFSASPVHADAYDELGGGRRFLYGVGSVAANVIPGVSVWAASKCLPGYVVCKLTFAGLGTLAAGSQLFWGGDVDGAGATAGRAFGGDWFVTPRQLATGAGADPYPEPEGAEDEDFLPDF